MTGPIPEALGSLSNLQQLDLGFNELTGPIPEALGSLSNLTSLGLRNNALTGPIPEALGSLSNLQLLGLRNNASDRADSRGAGQPVQPHVAGSQPNNALTGSDSGSAGAACPTSKVAVSVVQLGRVGTATGRPAPVASSLAGYMAHPGVRAVHLAGLGEDDRFPGGAVRCGGRDH